MSRFDARTEQVYKVIDELESAWLRSKDLSFGEFLIEVSESPLVLDDEALLEALENYEPSE